jgi:hypothetical protein
LERAQMRFISAGGSPKADNPSTLKRDGAPNLVIQAAPPRRDSAGADRHGPTRRC